jgi:HEAT repeat protein
MVTFFCPNCWSEVKEGEKVCPRCGVEISKVLDQRDYIGKLIAALSHPEPTTPLRAAWLLGKLRARSAVGALLDLLQGGADPYVKAAAVEALGQIGEASAEGVLAELAERGPVLLRGKAEEALRRLRATTASAPQERQI